MFQRALTIKSFYVDSVERLSYRDDYIYQIKASQVQQEVTITLTCDVNYYDDDIGGELIKNIGEYISRLSYHNFYRTVEIGLKFRTKDVKGLLQTLCETTNNDCMTLVYLGSNDELTSKWARCFIRVFEPFEPEFIKRDC